jgi:hypothetical protein
VRRDEMGDINHAHEAKRYATFVAYHVNEIVSHLESVAVLVEPADAELASLTRAVAAAQRALGSYTQSRVDYVASDPSVPGFLDGLSVGRDGSISYYIQAKPQKIPTWISFDVMHVAAGDYVAFVDNRTGCRYRVSGLEWAALGLEKPTPKAIASVIDQYALPTCNTPS